MSMMTIVWEKGNKEIENSLVPEAREAAESCGMDVTLFPFQRKGGEDLYTCLREKDPDYILTFDMAGFEKTTLQEGAAYEILYAKQLHVLLNSEEKHQKFLRRDQPLNFFFFVQGEKTAEKYKREYPQLLNIDEMGELKIAYHLSEEERDSNRMALQKIIKKVKKEVETAGTI